MNTDALLAWSSLTRNIVAVPINSACSPPGGSGHFDCINTVPTFQRVKLYENKKWIAAGCGVYEEGAEETVGRKEKHWISSRDNGSDVLSHASLRYVWMAVVVHARKQIVQRLITGSFKVGACCPVGRRKYFTLKTARMVRLDLQNVSGWGTIRMRCGITT